MDHVGMDLGRKQSQVAWLSADGEIVHRRVATTRDALRKVFGGQPPVRVLVEASGASEWVARFLEELGHEVVVGDPNFAPMYMDRTRHVKTDRRDAEALVFACRKGNYRKTHRLSDEARLLRARVKVRKGLVRARARSIAQVGALLAPHGVHVPTGKSKGFRARLSRVEAPKEVLVELHPLLVLMELLDEQIEELDTELAGLVEHDPVLARLASVPAVGPVIASTWVATLDRADRFACAGALTSYLGLVPREWSSSEVQRRGPITKAGPTELRDLLVEAAWNVLRQRKPETAALRDWALAVAVRRGRAKAAVALARRLARIVYACWRDERGFEAGRLASQAPASMEG